MKCLKIVMLALGLVSLTAHAELIPLKHKSQLTGCYERINFSPELAKQMNPVEYWAQPYQWFCFKKDGTLFHVMSSHYQKQTARTLKNTPDLSVLRYDLLGRGMIKIEGANAEQETYWQVLLLDKSTVASDGTTMPKNTLMMGMINPQRGTVVYWRYLKKLK